MSDVAEAIAVNLFLQPNVVRWLIDYFLGSHTPLDELTDGRHTTRLEELENDTRALADALQRRPISFELEAQVGVLGHDRDAKPRVQVVCHWLGPAFAVPDSVFLDARLAELTTILATLTAAPNRFWTNVVHGGLGGHVIAQGFRFPDILASAYSPPFMVAVMIDAQLDALAKNIDPQLLLIHGPVLLEAIGKALVPRYPGTPQLPANDAAIVRELARLLRASTDFSETHAIVKVLVANMGKLALAAYDETRERAKARPSVAGGDVASVMDRAFDPA